jgi:predicted porin
MQKKLIALAITAAFASAPAFADTSVYGLLDTGFGSVSNTNNVGNAGTKTGESGVAFSQNQTSKVGVKSSEDLGNGMSITYLLEMGLSSNPAADADFGHPVVGDNGAAGNLHSGFATNTSIGPDRVLALDLNLGQGTDLIAGKVSSPLRGIVYGNDAQYGSNLIGNLVTMDGSLTARAVALAAVHNFGVVTGSLAVLDNTVTADGAPDAKTGNGFEATAVYKQQALSVSFGYRNTKSSAAVPAAGTDVTTKDTILAANYDFGVAKLYGQFAQVKADDAFTNGSDKKTYETGGVNVPFTSTLAGYVEMSVGKHETTVSNNYSAYGVGVKYDMSKATWAYAHVGSAKEDTVSKVDQMAIGLVHSF